MERIKVFIGHKKQNIKNATIIVVSSAIKKNNPEIIDQDIPDFVIVRNGDPIGKIDDQHGLIFTNFRGDRAIEFSERLSKSGTQPNIGTQIKFKYKRNKTNAKRDKEETTKHKKSFSTLQRHKKPERFWWRKQHFDANNR